MLKQRVLTAVVLVAIVLTAIVWFSPLWFEVFVALVIALGAWEWSALAGLPGALARSVFTLVSLAAMFVLAHAAPELGAALMQASVLWWLLALVLVCLYPKGAALWHRRAVLLPLGLVVLLPGFVALVTLRAREDHVFFILLLIALIAAADSGAYFSGRAFGKRKLAVHVSPNKTWEGFIGGMLTVCAVLWIALLARGVEIGAARAVLLTFGALVLGAASVVGDLFESMLKRQAGIKDSGTLLPGHGGVLDRIDSLTAALPVYSVLLLQAGIL
jgi:phosphatidate cytidylyltransferase